MIKSLKSLGLNSLIERKDLVIQKADKSNTVVITERNGSNTVVITERNGSNTVVITERIKYLERKKSPFSGSSKFMRLLPLIKINYVNIYCSL